MAQIENEYPPLVIVMLTWAGPPERNIGNVRLEYIERSVESIRKHLIYPNLSWHIADDGSDEVFQQCVLEIIGENDTTFSDTHAGGDVGANLNIGYAAGFDRADVVLLWHDDRYLKCELDLRPYVDLLTQYDDVCQIRLKPKSARMIVHRIERCGETWWRVDKKGKQIHAVDIGPHVSHRRFRDFYGPYPTGLRPDICENEMSWRFRELGQDGGPDVFCHDSRIAAVEVRWGDISTWEWQQKGMAHEIARYRNYGTIRAQSLSDTTGAGN